MASNVRPSLEGGRMPGSLPLVLLGSKAPFETTLRGTFFSGD